MQYCFKVRENAHITFRYNQAPKPAKDNIRESDKSTSNITYMRAQRLAFSQQVTTKLLGTEKTVLQRQTQNLKKRYEKIF